MGCLPIYLVVDTSWSMLGESIQAADNGIRVLLNTYQLDPFALKNASVSVILFDTKVKVLFPLTPIKNVQIPLLKPRQCASFLGAALDYLLYLIMVDEECFSGRNTWGFSPLIFIFTDGSISDLKTYCVAAEKIMACSCNIIAITTGSQAKKYWLKKITNNINSLDLLDCSLFLNLLGAHLRKYANVPQ